MRIPLRALLLPLLLVLTLKLPALPVAAAPAGEGPAIAEEAPLAEPPTLLSPPDGARTTGASDPPIGLPTLRWAPVPGATRYHVQLSPSAGFANLLVDQDTYAAAYSPGTALADGTYYWRVKMIDADKKPGAVRGGPGAYRQHGVPARSDALQRASFR